MAKKLFSVRCVTALILVVSMLLTMLPVAVCGAENDSVLWGDTVTDDTLISLDFETEYLYSETHTYTNTAVYYDENCAENWTSLNNNRGNRSELITETDGNTAVLFTWDDGNNNENYNANDLMNIYDPSTKTTFIGEAGKWYNITFKVKVTESDNIPLQFYLATCGRTYLNAATTTYQIAFSSTDCNFNHINAMRVATAADLRVYAAGDTFTAPTDGWVTVSANWYADGTHFPVIGVTANNKTKISDLTEYAEVLVDDVTVTENCAYIDFETDLSSYYGAHNTNWTASNGRYSENELITLDDGNNVARLTWEYDDFATDYIEYYNACALNIYDSYTGSKFVGEAGKTYDITFDYYVENTDDQKLQFFISKCGRSNMGTTDMGPSAMQTGSSPEPSYVAITDFITTASSDWVTVTATFTADGSTGNNSIANYPVLILQANEKQIANSTSETYASVLIDNIKVTQSNEVYTGFDLALNETEHSSFYNSGGLNNWTSGSGRGNNASWATDTDGNSVIRLTWDTDNSNENYNANNALKILDPDTGTRFAGDVGTEYVISFKYKVENDDDKALQFYLAPCNRVGGKNPTWVSTDLGSSDLGPKATIASSTTEFIPAGTTYADGEWHTAYAEWTGQAQINEFDVYPLILLECNSKTTDSSKTENFASVLIDDISVKINQTGSIPAYNYDGENTVMIEITRSTTFADLDIPERKGWIFEGFYTNADLTEKADDGDLVGNYNAIYVKWSGDGTAMTPSSVGEAMSFAGMKAFDNCTFENGTSLSYTRNTDSVQVGTSQADGWGGEYVFSADTLTTNDSEKIIVDNVAYSTPAHSIMLYVELPDFEAADTTYALSLGSRGLCLRTTKTDGSYDWNWFKANSDGTSTFAYTDEGEWKTSTLSSDGAFMGLPSSYKGYIRLDFDKLTGSIDVATAEYIFSCIELEPNVVGGKCGDLVLGGIVYIPETRTDSTVWSIKNTVNSSIGTYNYFYYDIAPSSVGMGVNPYDVYSENYSVSTRYSGTAAEPAVKLTEKKTSAFWATSPVAITTLSGKQETTRGYMTTYTNGDTSITLQPGVDSFMFYVELPEFTESTVYAPLKLLDTTLYQTGTAVNLSFSNSAYQYASVYDGIWQTARAGADGDLKDIPSGFKGFIRFCVKDFKNINDVSYYTSDGTLKGIDLSKPYSITKFELGFNHIGGENGELVIGGVYSIIVDSELPFVKHGISGELFCFKAIPGDYDASGSFSAEEIVNIRKSLIGDAPEFDAVAALRAENNDITTLVAATLGMADTSNKGTDPVYPEIFSADVGTTSGAVVYDRVYTDPNNYQVIAQDYEAYQEKGDAFAAEILANQIGTFEKTGIDKMCHVSTFLYAKGNIYMSYYANSITSGENPKYQVARLAYAPEDKPEDKIIIDIMQVGDELYGKKITGVYDTILMSKEDEPDNLYILWTAAVNGEYYRLYQVFNMETEELGPIGVNRFKVGDTVNDFSREGMKKALNSNGIGYKTFASDIGIMQKLSTRIENGETYYYTGAYCCDFTCIIKSKDLITWEYVAQPNEGVNGTGFDNCTRWENAVYVIDDKVYYYVRQWNPLGIDADGSTTTETTNRTENGSYYGILTAYDLITGEWETPILVEDCQSRSDFIMYKDNLYLIYAPTPDSGETQRQHLGILKIDTENLANTSVVLQAKMGYSCFYPFWQYNSSGELCISYTYSRKEIRLASFTLSDYLD